MQQSGEIKTLKTKVLVIITALAWAGGLLLAGSDGPLMPYLNGAGVVVFLCASLVLGRILPGLEKGGVMSAARPLPKMSRASRPARVRAGRRRRAAVPESYTGGIHPRYARELGLV